MNKDKDTIRSKKVRELLGEIPPSLVRWNTAILIMIFLSIVIIMMLSSYPEGNGESIMKYLMKSLCL